MEQLLEQIAYCIEFGKVDQKTPYPPGIKGQEGADELTGKALEERIKSKEILEKAPDTKIIIGGAPVTDKFRSEIGADFYSPDPDGAVKYLNQLVS